MTVLSNNPPVTILELNQEMHDFLMRHCEVNINLILNTLHPFDKEGAVAAVAVLENFKKLKRMLDK